MEEVIKMEVINFKTNEISKRPVFEANLEKVIPKRKMDGHTVLNLARCLTSKYDIARYFGTTIEYLDYWSGEQYGMDFDTLQGMFEAETKLRLRSKQLEMAEVDVKMAIFLGKNVLGQSEKTESNINHNTSVTIVDDI